KAEGYISETAVIKIADHLKIPTSKVFAVSSFYDQFKFTESAKYNICLCNGTACHMKGSGHLLKDFKKTLGISENQTKGRKLFSVETKPCMGACGMAPVAKVNEVFYSNPDAGKIIEIIASIKEKEGV
ncbi:MAG: NAD(P)H-dependent oxidoreductase subunit E, partial [Bacteroidales bacterium]|nr:NAD(P)H-dependent oxidoreductase subunit E [Bacteroidales bacterium]